MGRIVRILLGACCLLAMTERGRAAYDLQVVNPSASGVYVYRSTGGGSNGGWMVTSFTSMGSVASAGGGSVALIGDSGFGFRIDNDGYGGLLSGTTSQIVSPSLIIGNTTPITYRIVGTAGETGPVRLSVSSTYHIELGSGFWAWHQVNNSTIPVPLGASGVTSFNFNVGDTFQYSASLNRVLAGPSQSPSPRGIATFSTGLSVAPVPEPGALISIACGAATLLLAAGSRGSCRRRRAGADRG